MAGATLNGASLLSEIKEQPDALIRLTESTDRLEEAASAIRTRRMIRFAAHGSSDNAAAYGIYAFGLIANRTSFRDVISLPVYLGVDIDMHDSVVLALSQSGETPDVVSYATAARAAGAICIAITNEPDSSLAANSDVTVELHAGVENSVAATKTYTNQLAVLALLAGFAADKGDQVLDGIRDTASLMPQVLSAATDVAERAAERTAATDRMFSISRGPEMATAREVALKVTETCSLVAAPLTSTDLAHGPLAAMASPFPMWVVAPDDGCLPAVLAAAELAKDVGALLIASGPRAEEVEGAAFTFQGFRPPSPVLSPLLSVIEGQLFARSLAIARKLDPDHPTFLTKITRAP